MDTTALVSQEALPVVVEETPAVPWERMIASFLDTLRTTSTRRTYKPTLRELAAFLGGEGPRDIGADLLAAWARSVREAVEAGEISPNTGKRKVMAAKSFFRFAHLVGQSRVGKDLRAFVLEAPRERVLKPFQVLSEGEEAALLEATPERHRAAVATMLYAGLRVSEVCRLNASDYYEDGGGLWLRVHGKGDKVRNVPVSDTRLRPWLGEPGGGRGALFRSRQGNGHYNRTRLFQVVQRAIEDAGIGKRVSPHSLRHTAAMRWLFKDDVPLPVVQVWLGHESLDATRKYVSHFENGETRKYMK